MVVTWRRKKSMQQMSRIAGDPSEKTVVGLGTYDVESLARCWTKTETNRAAQECLKTRLVFRICEAPPGRRSVRQPGNDCGLEHELERVRRKTRVVSACARQTGFAHMLPADGQRDQWVRIFYWWSHPKSLLSRLAGSLEPLEKEWLPLACFAVQRKQFQPTLNDLESGCWQQPTSRHWRPQ